MKKKMVRQRTKRWGFDLGGQYILGIAKQERYGEDVLEKQNKPKKKKSKRKKVSKENNGLRMLNPFA